MVEEVVSRRFDIVSLWSCRLLLRLLCAFARTSTRSLISPAAPLPKRPRLEAACEAADQSAKRSAGPLELSHAVHFRDRPCDELFLTEAEAAALHRLIRQTVSEFQPLLLRR